MYQIFFPITYRLHVTVYIVHCLPIVLPRTTRAEIESAIHTTNSKRTSNWSKNEVMLLRQLIEEEKKIIKGKFSPDLTIKDKRPAWQYITNSLNTVSGVHRQREQIEKQNGTTCCPRARKISMQDDACSTKQVSDSLFCTK